MHSPIQKRSPNSFVRKAHQISRKANSESVSCTRHSGSTSDDTIHKCDELLNLVSAQAGGRENAAERTDGLSKEYQSNYEGSWFASMLGGVDGIELPQTDFMDFSGDDGLIIEQTPFTKFKLRRMGAIKITPSNIGKRLDSKEELTADMGARSVVQNEQAQHGPEIDAQLSQGCLSNKVLVGPAALSLRRMRKSRSPAAELLAEPA